MASAEHTRQAGSGGKPGPQARYDLTGPEGARAESAGLTSGRWYRSPIDRRRMKELMRRSDGPALRDTAIWLGLLAGSGTAGGLLWGTWWAAPCFLVYGVLYGSAGDSRWHEAGHGTVFRTRWMADVVYQIASFMMMRDPTVWRWSHTRHHTDTLIVGRDPEIAAMRPAKLARILANFFGLVDVPLALRDMVRHALGRSGGFGGLSGSSGLRGSSGWGGSGGWGGLGAEEATFIPESERSRVYRTARIWLAIYAATVGLCVLTGSVMPLVYIGGPRMYGTFMHLIYGLTQHAGLGENVLDHRLNTRTVRMCRVNRFLYWNMNYHVEHHMFPMIPNHRLPELHEEIKHDLAPVYPSIWAAYRELVPAVLRQLRDQTHYVRRTLPTTARPFQEV